MSTSTLLIVSASLRSHRGERRAAPPASCEPVSGRSQDIGSVRVDTATPFPSFRHSRAGAGPSRDALPGRARWQVGAGALLLLQRSRAGLAALSLMLATLAGDAAIAQVAAPSPPDMALPTMAVEAEPAGSQPSRIGGPPPGPCVTVDIAGHRAGHLECATDRLQAAADTAQAQTRSAIETPVIGAGSPDVQTGVANQTATRQRMGNTFGTSVHPQRPNRPVLPPRGGTPQ